MNHLNLDYLESLYEQFKKSPESVELEWRRFFEGVDFSKDFTKGAGVSEKELDVYHLISAYRNYGHFEAFYVLNNTTFSVLNHAALAGRAC